MQSEICTMEKAPKSTLASPPTFRAHPSSAKVIGSFAKTVPSCHWCFVGLAVTPQALDLQACHSTTIRCILRRHRPNHQHAVVLTTTSHVNSKRLVLRRKRTIPPAFYSPTIPRIRLLPLCAASVKIKQISLQNINVAHNLEHVENVQAAIGYRPYEAI